MRIKPIIINLVEPVLKEKGFILCLEKGEYIFTKQNNSQVITFDREKYSPRKIRILFQVMQPIPISFYYSYLDPSFCPYASETYNEEELIVYITQVLTAITEIILPYMDNISINAVPETYELCHALSLDTESRAKRFLARWGLDMNHKNRNNFSKLDIIINQLQTDICHRHKDFLYHQDEVIDMAAYFGALNAISSGASPFQHWYWREIVPGKPIYVSGNNGYDSLDRVLAAWNYGQEITNYSLKNFPM